MCTADLKSFFAELLQDMVGSGDTNFSLSSHGNGLIQKNIVLGFSTKLQIFVYVQTRSLILVGQTRETNSQLTIVSVTGDRFDIFLCFWQTSSSSGAVTHAFLSIKLAHELYCILPYSSFCLHIQLERAPHSINKSLWYINCSGMWPSTFKPVITTGPSPPDKRASMVPGVSRLNEAHPWLPVTIWLGFHYTDLGTGAIIAWKWYDTVENSGCETLKRGVLSAHERRKWRSNRMESEHADSRWKEVFVAGVIRTGAY